MTTATRKIHAEIHPAAMEKVTRFFSASVEDIITEVFQNARRAGAQNVDVKIDDESMTITDDGRGIEDPAILLSFGGSEWNPNTRRQEDPAGMGLYSLAGVGATIISRPRADEPGWRCTLLPKHFSGEAEAEVTPDETLTHRGTRISTLRELRTSAHAAENAADRAALHSPMNIRINGRQARRRGFLNSADAPGTTYLEPRPGREYAVTPINASDADRANNNGTNLHAIVTWSSGLAVRPRLTSRPYMTRRYERQEDRINFHGHTIESPSSFPSVGTLTGIWRADVDASREANIRFVLPARKELVMDENADAIRDKTERSIFEIIARQPEPEAVTFEAWKRSLELDLETPLPEHPRTMKRWTARPANSTACWVERTPPRFERCIPTGLVVDDLMKPHIEAMLEHAWPADRVLYESTPEYEGFDWYDRLPRITRVSVRFRRGDEWIELRNNTEFPAGAVSEVAELRVIAHVEDPKTGAAEIECPAQIAFKHDEDDYVASVDDITMLISHADPPDANTMTAMMMAGYFDPDDCDEDGTATQYSDFKLAAEAASTEALHGRDAARNYTIAEKMRKYVMPHVPHNLKTVITCEASGRIDIQTETQLAS